MGNRKRLQHRRIQRPYYTPRWAVIAMSGLAAMVAVFVAYSLGR